MGHTIQINSAMKIVFSTDQIYLHGGIEKVLSHKANYFADTLGYEVIILTSEQHCQPPCYPLSKKIRLLDIGVNYNRNKSYFSKKNLIKIPFHFKQLYKTIKEVNPDIWIVVSYSFDFYWIPFIRRGVPKCKEFHSSHYIEAQSNLTNAPFLKRIRCFFNRWVESKYDKLIVLNPDEQLFFKSKNSIVVPNPIPDSVQPKAPLVNRQALAAGRIAPVKGFEKLIDSWKLVTKKFPDWQLHIYGEDYLDTRRKLENQILELRLENNVSFKGVSADMTATMQDYALYVMSSQTECFPMVLLEAMSCGIPCVSFDCPTGPRNIITDGKDGLLAEQDNVVGLADKIIYLIENPDILKIMGESAKENIKRFSSGIVMEKWQKLFKKLLQDTNA
jgi:glycosyltransferase involved in cell wall biosynthesis